MEVTWELADPAGDAIRQPTSGLIGPLQFTRNAAAAGALRLDLEDLAAIELAGALANGLPRLRVYLDGDLVLNGVWQPMSEEADVDSDEPSAMTLTFRDPLALLEGRYTAATRVFPATDAGTIAWTLISETNAADGATGIRVGTIAPTVTRDRTYEHKQVAEAIQQLTQVQNGFDFQVTPVDEGTIVGKFDVWAAQGNDLTSSAVFEYGPDTLGNVRRLGRQTRLPVNRARVLGANGLVGEDFDAASIAKYGTCMVLEQQVDVSEQATLDAKATALLRPEPIQVVEFSPDPDLTPTPRLDFWLGDVVTVRAREGALIVDVPARVNAITLTPDEEGNVAAVAVAIEQGAV